MGLSKILHVVDWKIPLTINFKQTIFYYLYEKKKKVFLPCYLSVPYNTQKLFYLTDPNNTLSYNIQ